MTLNMTFSVITESAAQNQTLTRDLADQLRGIDDSIEITRLKDVDDTMDLGATIAVIATSTAATAIATGIKIWLTKHQGASLKITKEGEVLAEGVTSKDAVRLAGLLTE